MPLETSKLAGTGGGICTSGGSTLDLGNTIVAGNTGTGTNPNYDDIRFEGGIVRSQGNNLIGDSPGDSTGTDKPITYQASDIRDTNPLLGPLQNNGGKTPTHALLAGSPAVDKGNNNYAVEPSIGGGPLSFDQRGTGFPRIVDGDSSNSATFDIGAFESAFNGKIVFVSNRDGNEEIYTMNSIDGSGVTRLTNNPSIDREPSFSPDGRIVFTSYRDGNAEIYTMNSDGSAPTRLTINSTIDGSPSFSPDGSRIVFVSYGGSGYDLFTMNSGNGSGVIRLTNTAYPIDEGEPFYSPDGSKIVYTIGSDNGLGWNIHTMNADGSGVRSLTTGTVFNGYARWLPFSINTTSTTATGTGQNVTVVPTNNLNMTFSNVTTAGTTTATALSQNQLQPLPANFSLTSNPIMYNITTSAVYSGNITVTFNVSNIADAQTCNKLRSLHYENGAWTTNTNAAPLYNSGTKVCTVSQMVTSLSPFVVAQYNGASYTISGQVSNSGNALPEVSIVLSGSLINSTTTDSSGNYSFTVNEGGNYTVTPSLTNYTFTPPSLTFNNISSNQTANFAASSTCSYSINPTSASVGSTSSSGSTVLTAAAGCAWTAVSNSDWLTVTSGASGSGGSTVGYSAAANSGALRTGTITIGGQTFTVNQAAAAGYSISGLINYGITPSGQAAKFVPGVVLNATGNPTVSATSSSPSGAYQLNGLGSGAYTVTPTKSGDVNRITANDSLLIQRYLAYDPNANLTSNQLVAAETNNDGRVNTTDALYIQQYLAYITTPTPNIIEQWKFLPGTQNYTLTSNQTNQNYTAVLVGEVDGNWVAPGTSASLQATSTTSESEDAKAAAAAIDTNATDIEDKPLEIEEPRQAKESIKYALSAAESAVAAAVSSVTVSLPTNATASTGTSVTIPINVSQLPALTDANAVKTYAFSVQYNATVLQYTGFDTTGTLSASGGTVACGQPPPDATNNRIVSCNYTNPSGITGQGTLLKLNFTVIGTSGQPSALTFVGTQRQPDPFIFNNGDPQAVTSNGSFTVTGTTAASVTVGGRVLTSDGRGITNVLISLTNTNGQIRTATTGEAGHYRFEGVEVGQTYILSVRAKRYTFSRPQQVISINEETEQINFMAEAEKRSRVF